MALTLDDLFTSPNHYLHSFEGDDAVFVPMDRAAFHRSIFLDDRISVAADGSMKLPLSTLLGVDHEPQRMGWIFHMAHGGSTLLARALDRLERNLILREPLALRQLGLSPDAARLRVVRAMLGKRYLTNAPTIVKANVPVNFILPSLAALGADDRAVFLYSGLRDYLLAVLRTPQHRNWVSNVTSQLSNHLGDLSALTDAQRAAALWYFQMQAFAAAIAIMPGAVSLDSETLFAQPHDTLSSAAAHLHVPIPAGQIEGIVTGPIFNTYAKRPEITFDNDAREARRNQLEREIASELVEGVEWVLQQGGGEDWLDRPLLDVTYRE
jgi:hypothetical protein